ncbi:outer membrane protein assembly factor BamB family protein [Halocatena halophila]|uniref:outer membrane protein assembly factor BamB family protein n=1 Tax=Halocatena halophila TaxID=2814576 RepID=UPI002ED00B92
MSESDFSRRHFLAACASGVLAGCLGADSPSNAAGAQPISADQQWPTVGYDTANTRAVAATASVPRPTVDWRQSIGTDVREPIVAGKTVFVPQADGLLALEVETGHKQWQYAVSGTVTPPAVHGNSVYVGVAGGDAAIVALDRHTGDRRWSIDRAEIGQVTAGPTVTNDGHKLLTGTDTERIVSIETTDGTIDWQRSVFGPVTAALGVASEYLVATTNAGEVYGFTTDGSGLWRTSLSGGCDVPPVITTRNVFVVDTESVCYALDPVTGAQQWKSYQTALQSDGMVVGNGSIYAVSDQQVRAITTDSGTTTWKETFDHTIEAAPLLVGSTLLLGAGPTLVALDADGGTNVAGLRFDVRNWTHKLGRRIGPAVTVGNERLFVPVMVDSGETELVALHWQ